MEFLQYILSGLMMGSLYVLLGLTIVLIFKATKVFNLSIGGMLTLGAFVFYLLTAQLKLPIWLSLILFFVFAILLGWLLERLIFRPLIGQPIVSAIMVTLALYAFFEGLVTASWGAIPKSYPFVLGAFSLKAVKLSYIHLLATGVMILFIIAFALFFRFHKMVLAMRATAEDHQLAQSVGIDVKIIFALSWIIVALVCGVVGIFMGSIQGVSVYLPLTALKAFVVALLWGLESISGAIIAGLIIGILEGLSIGYITHYLPGFQDVLPWVIALLILLFKPYGLFGLVRIERI